MMLRSAIRRVAARAGGRGVRWFSGAREPVNEGKFPELTFATKQLIGGELVGARSGATFDSINPGNGEVLAQVPRSTEEDINDAVQAAHDAFYFRGEGAWREKAPRERAACLYKLSDLIMENVEELAQLESLDNGKPFSQSISVDAPVSGLLFKYYASWCDKLVGQHIPIGDAFHCYTRHEPVGVCGLIIPWNLPLIAAAAKLGPSLAAGNTTVLKLAENTSLSALRLAELVQEAGFPDGVVNIVSGLGNEAGEALINHPKVDKISFTGSVEVGRHIQSVSGKDIKRVTLELGGKNPLLFFNDFDVSKAVEQAHNALFWNDGEACAAGSRVFVQESIYDEFVKGAVEMAEARRVGHPFAEGTAQGAQVSQAQFEKVMGFIENGAERGEGTLLTGGHRVGTVGNYIKPTVFSDVKDDSDLFTKELFGPIQTITKFPDEASDPESPAFQELVARANNTEYGLAAGFFSNDQRIGHALTQQVRAGMCFWNCYHVVDMSAPFGGFKQSGFGREGGLYGMLPYMEVKNCVHSVR